MKHKVKIQKSSRKNKQFKVVLPDREGTEIHFSDPRYSIKPGTENGQRYCTRSAAQDGADDIYSPAYWARVVWGCKGSKSFRNKAKKIGQTVLISDKKLKS